MKNIINRKVFIIAFFAVVLLLILLPVMQSCKKLDFEKVVRIKTGEISNVTSNSASITGFIQDVGENGITQYGHCWSKDANPTVNLETKTAHGIRNNTGNFYSDITGLSQSTTYYIRAYATNSQETVYGIQLNFNTLSGEIDTNSFTDSRDGHIYNWVQIGDQVWMAENLAYLPAVSPPSSESYTEPYYYVYGYEGTSISEAKVTANYEIYGVLYNWPAAMNGQASSSTNPSGVQGVCPSGWHLPSDAEWKQLEIYLGMSQADADATGWRGTTEGGKLKETGTNHWNSPNEGATNSSGFTALPGGYRNGSGNFSDIGGYGLWWSATEGDVYGVWKRNLGYDYTNVSRSCYDELGGFSVRCVKDNADYTPVVAFTASPTTIIAGQSVQFTDLSTNLPTSWSWDFGDGDTSTDQNPSHTYSKTGTYTVTLTANNSYGSDSETKTNYITVNAPGDPPVAAFTASSTTIAAGQNVTFTDQTTNSPTSWSWVFGDGGTSTSQNPSHTYTTAGTYTVTLKVTNSFGSDSLTKLNFITAGNPPVAAFTASPTTVTTGQSIQFTDQSTNSPISWSWDFGDGGRSSIQNPSHAYLIKGTYTVSLMVTNNYGSDTETKTNYISVSESGSSDTSTIADIDGNNYKTIKIGTQWWMAENLKTTKYNDGTAIPLETDEILWRQLETPAYCWRDNDSATYKATYGAYYNWFVVSITINGGKNVCPSGWHVPTDTEWTTLIDYLGGESVAGGKLKETGYTHWNDPNTGATNESEFAALAGGYREGVSYGLWDPLGRYGNWWSTTEYSSVHAMQLQLFFNDSKALIGYDNKNHGFNIRCIED